VQGLVRVDASFQADPCWQLLLNLLLRSLYQLK
jgi:hypothetical protein